MPEITINGQLVRYRLTAYDGRPHTIGQPSAPVVTLVELSEDAEEDHRLALDVAREVGGVV